MSANVLVGKTLTGMKIAADKEAILFQTADGDIVVLCDADCCSYTWVEHIELPALGFPAVVVSVADLEMPEGKPSLFHTDSDCLDFYGCKIVTDKGEIVIDYRNDSNGDYGGSLSWPGEYIWQNRSKQEWVEVTP
jgi:hypothetical protein